MDTKGLMLRAFYATIERNCWENKVYIKARQCAMKPTEP